MKASSGLFIFILILWMGGSSYWYICKIKNHCNECSTEISEKPSSDDNVEIQVLPENDTLDEKSNEKIIENLKKKILNGYIVYNFLERVVKRIG